MKSKLNFFILSFFFIGISWSCNKHKITFSQVLSVVGTYKGELLECGDEFEQLPIYNPTLDTIQSFAELPYERRFTITYVDKTVASDLNSSNYGFSDLKSTGKGLLVETCWFCLDGVDASGEKIIQGIDSVYSEIKMPILMEVVKVRDVRTGLEMPSSLQGKELKVKILKSDNSIDSLSYKFNSLTGFYYNAALQLEYELEITKPSAAATTITNTLTALKN